ncbi:MAG: dienelactone hydrolase family protein [Alphaproteobacteria bacterium]|nr:dienelactone hydrolase family protein [Alphaproteobacteria bacterium]
MTPLKTIFSSCEKPAYLCVFLHGYGADAQDLAGLFPYYRVLNNVLCVSIEAPHAIPGYPMGKEWYPLDDSFRQVIHQRDSKEIKSFLQKTESARNGSIQLLEKTIREICEARQILEGKVILTGFSQGAGLALALSQRIKTLGVMSFSGLLLPPYAGDVPLWLFHGEADSVIPFFYASQIYKQIQKERPCSFFPIPQVDHTISSFAIEKSCLFIKNACGQN